MIIIINNIIYINVKINIIIVFPNRSHAFFEKTKMLIEINTKRI